MKVLNPKNYITMSISESETHRFEAFLDRNFPDWRNREVLKAKNAGTISRRWLIGVDDIERRAIYRTQYVEVFDEYIDLDESGEAEIFYPMNIICDIDGDLTPVAVWAE